MSHHTIFLTVGIYAVFAGIAAVIASFNGHANFAVMAWGLAKFLLTLFLAYLAVTLLLAWMRQESRRNANTDD